MAISRRVGHPRKATAVAISREFAPGSDAVAVPIPITLTISGAIPVTLASSGTCAVAATAAVASARPDPDPGTDPESDPESDPGTDPESASSASGTAPCIVLGLPLRQKSPPPWRALCCALRAYLGSPLEPQQWFAIKFIWAVRLWHKADFGPSLRDVSY